MANTCIFLLGGARSGKSLYAQKLAGKLSKNVLFVATGEPLDDEMQARINNHKKSRPKSWHTLETSTNVGKQIKKHIGYSEVVIIDCLTLLVSNLLDSELVYSKAEHQILNEINQLIACMDEISASFIIVSNEIGMGLVPETKIGRIYRDLLGKANQLIAQYANEVYFMVAGIPVTVKGDEN